MPNRNVFNLVASQLKTLVYGVSEGTAKPVSTDYQGSINVRSNDAQFGTVLNSERTPIIDLKSVYGISVLRDVVTVTNATVTNNATEYLLQTNATPNAVATLESAERGRYVAGSAGEAGIAVRLIADVTGTQVATWGYFDDRNGAYFGQDSGGLFVTTLRDGTEIGKTYQANWNADPLNGTGPSGLTLNTTNGNIYRIVYSWYGYGTIEWQVVQGDANNVQIVIVVNRYRPVAQTSMTDPNLPIRARIQNGATTATSYSLFVASRQYSIQGKYEPERRITSQYNLNLTLTTSAFVPVVSFRRDPTFPIATRSNSASVKIEGFDMVCSVDLLYEIRFNPTLATASWQTPSDSTNTETAVQSDIAAIAMSGGIPIFAGIAGGGNKQSSFLSTQDNLNLDLTQSQPATLAVKPVTGTTATLSAVFRVREEW